jgi:RNA polymerase sigma-70 factor (ECF subfamily)
LALKAVHRLIGPRLFAVLIRMVKRREVAEDLLQDVFVTIWTKAHQFDCRRGNAEVWLFSIARRKAVDRLRLSTRESVGLDTDVATLEPQSATYAVVDAETCMAVKRCLKTLKPDVHQALQLCYALGMTHEELAAEMKVPLGTAKTWVRQGLMQLRDYMTGHERT